MGKVDAGRYRQGLPKLTVDDLHGGTFYPFTVAGFDEAMMRTEEGERLTPFLTFKETDKVLYVNATQVAYLIEGFGSDDTDDWIDRSVPVEKKKVEYRGTTHEKLWVAAPADWKRLLATAKKRGK